MAVACPGKNVMAYLNLDDLFSTPVAGRAPQVREAGAADAADAGSTGFTALEWTVIALAERDSPRSLTTPGRLSRAMGSVFGSGTASQLADPRLEALRRMAIHAWRQGFALPVSEIERFLSAGFVEAQIETLVTSVRRRRAANRPRSVLA